MLDVTLSQDLLNEEELQIISYTKFWPRVGASLIDRVVVLMITPLALYNALHWQSYLLFTGLTLMQFIYKPFLEYEYGATLGKMVLKMKIVNYQYQKAGLKEIFLRNITVIVESILTLLIGLYKYGYNSVSTESGSYEPAYIILIAVNILLVIFNIVDIIFLATAKDGRSLHDRIGKTFVIRRS